MDGRNKISTFYENLIRGFSYNILQKGNKWRLEESSGVFYV